MVKSNEKSLNSKTGINTSNMKTKDYKNDVIFIININESHIDVIKVIMYN